MDYELNPQMWDKVEWSEAHRIPVSPGCYALINKSDEVLYIGRSKVLWNRLRNPRLHRGFSRKKDPEGEVHIAWCCGWGVYDREKELIMTWAPPLSLT